MKTLKNICTIFSVSLVALVIVSSSHALAWSGPTGIPPNNNMPSPVNTTNVLQEISGMLTVRGYGSLGTAWFSTSTRASWPPRNLTLAANGSIGAASYCDDNGLNCRLFSDVITSGPAGPQGPVGDPVPAGTVVAFDLAQCPSTWSLYTAAQGRYVVGLANATARTNLERTVGRALSDGENRPAGNHIHTVNYINRTITGPTVPNGGLGNSRMSGSPRNDVYLVRSVPITRAAASFATQPSSNHIPGTNAPYIQLLYCIKN